MADYVVTESGFGAELGAEKFFNIKCRIGRFKPDAEVLVCSVRAMKMQSGRFHVRPGRPLPPDLLEEDLDALRSGSVNLSAHLAILQEFQLPIVVAINRFPSDSERELQLLSELALENGADRVAITDAFQQGGKGAIDLAQAVTEACQLPNSFQYLYSLDLPIKEKIECLATRVYGADAVDFAETAERQIHEIADWGFTELPICIAKTQYSLSHDPKLSGRPRGFRLPIREVHLAAGAGYLYALTEGINLMPGLPKKPMAKHIDLQPDGTIVGMK